MISDRVIENCIKEINEISGIGVIISDTQGNTIAKAGDIKDSDASVIQSFLQKSSRSMTEDDRIYIRISDEGEDLYVLISDDDSRNNVCARLAASQLQNLVIAYKDKIDRNLFFQALLLDNLLPVDIYNRARKLHVETSQKRCVFVIEPIGTPDGTLTEMVRELFFTEAGDHVTAVDEDRVVVIKALEEDADKEDLEETARMLVDMAGSEAMSDVRVAYGTITDDIKGVSKSYREAKMALEIGKLFYPLKRTVEYGNLGVGRLIYQLPVSLCRLFVKEIFGDDIPEEIDEETLTTVNRFFENSLNVSETSRQLFIHRNTLIYRIEKLQKATGLDVRVFDDALTLKIALMVVNYLKYADKDGSVDTA